MKIKLVLTDVDGCLTNGSVIYGPNHEKYKVFNMQDGMGVKILKENGYLTGILSSDESKSTEYRARDLNLDIIEIGAKDKLSIFENILKKYDISAEEVAYMGDDIQDLCILEKVGLAFAPKNAVEKVKSKVKNISNVPGGEGAFREFAEFVIKNNL